MVSSHSLDSCQPRLHSVIHRSSPLLLLLALFFWLIFLCLLMNRVLWFSVVASHSLRQPSFPTYLLIMCTLGGRLEHVAPRVEQIGGWTGWQIWLGIFFFSMQGLHVYLCLHVSMWIKTLYCEQWQTFTLNFGWGGFHSHCCWRNSAAANHCACKERKHSVLTPRCYFYRPTKVARLLHLIFL